jgi:hypothetical protein
MKNLTFLAISLALLAFIIFLTLGVYVGFELQSAPAPAPELDETPDGDTPSRNPEHRQILVVQVNSLAAETPQAESIFLVSLQSSSQYVSVILLDSFQNENHSLVNAFSLDPEQNFSQEFSSALQTRSLTYDHHILMDQFAFDKFLVWIEENRTNPGESETINSSDLLSDVSHPDLFPEAMTFLCKAASHLPIDANWMNLFLMLIPKHMKTSYPIDTLIVDWKYLNYTPDPFLCEVISP